MWVWLVWLQECHLAAISVADVADNQECLKEFLGTPTFFLRRGPDDPRYSGGMAWCDSICGISGAWNSRVASFMRSFLQNNQRGTVVHVLDR